MNLVRLLTLRSLRTRPLRTILSIFGIVLGVACLLAIRVTNLTALDSIVALFEDTSGKSDLIILPAESDGDGIPISLISRLQGQPGLDLAVPSLQVQTAVEDQAMTEDLGFSMFGPGLGGLSIYGIDPAVDPEVRGYALAQGEFLAADLDASEILLVDEFAADNDLQVGNQVALLTPTGTEKLKLVGLLAKEGPGQINNGAFGVVPLETLQSIFNRQDRIDQVDLLVSGAALSSADLDRIKDDFQARLGPEYRVTYPASQGQRVGQMLDGYQIGLNFLSGMALFVGAFLIYNAFSMTVVERTREFGFMRTIGVTRRQIIFLVIFEAGLLGFVGSILGAAFGILMARGLTAILATLLDQQALVLNLPQDVLFSSIFIGVLTTLIAAAIPAFQAGRTSPLAALRIRGGQREGWLMRWGWVIGGLLLLFSTYVLILNPFPYDVQFRLGSITVFSLFFGGTMIIPVSVGIWERLVRPLVRLFYGNSGRIGSGNIQRSKLRTTLTVAALMVGVAMIMVTRGMTDSFRTDLEVWIDAYIGGDLFVNSSVPMGTRVMRHLESVDGVAAVAPVRYFEVVWERPDQERENLIFMAFDPAAHTRVTSFVFSDSGQDPQQALDLMAAGDAVFVSSVLSEKYGLTAGDTLQLKTRSGFHPFKVAAVVVDFYNQGQVIQGNWNDMRRYFRLNDADLYLVKVAAGTSVPAVSDRIDAAYGKRDNLTIVSNESIIDRALQLLKQSYSLFDVLALIAMLVAGMGVVNTLTMNVMERTREIGMLRSIGMTRRQIVQMILAESGIMGLVGGGFGLIFGIVLTRIFLWSMTAMSGYKLDFILPVTAVVAGFLVALIVSQFAAVFPARRAVRTRILEAIQYE